MGDYSNLRCLFVTKSGDQFCRTVFNRLNYLVPEIGIYGKEIQVEAIFALDSSLDLSQVLNVYHKRINTKHVFTL